MVTQILITIILYLYLTINEMMLCSNYNVWAIRHINVYSGAKVSRDRSRFEANIN